MAEVQSTEVKLICSPRTGEKDTTGSHNILNTIEKTEQTKRILIRSQCMFTWKINSVIPQASVLLQSKDVKYEINVGEL